MIGPLNCHAERGRGIIHNASTALGMTSPLNGEKCSAAQSMRETLFITSPTRSFHATSIPLTTCAKRV